MLMLTEYIPDELQAVSQRLENWGRWARDNGSTKRCAASAEGKYRPRWGNNETAEDYEERLRRGDQPEVDALDAMHVGRILAPAGGFPERTFRLLRLRYFELARKPVLCRKLGIHIQSYDRELVRALYTVRNVLTRHQDREYARGVSADTSRERPLPLAGGRVSKDQESMAA